MKKTYLVRQVVTIEYEQMIEAESEAEIMNFQDKNSQLSKTAIEKLENPKYYGDLISQSNVISEIIVSVDFDDCSSISEGGYVL